MTMGSRAWKDETSEETDVVREVKVHQLVQMTQVYGVQLILLLLLLNLIEVAGFDLLFQLLFVKGDDVLLLGVGD